MNNNYHKYKKYKILYKSQLNATDKIQISGSSNGELDGNPKLVRSSSAPTSIDTTLTATQYVDYAINRINICIKKFNPLNYVAEKNRYLIFFDAFQNNWEKVRNSILKHSGIKFNCLLVTYEYEKCTHDISPNKTTFISQLTRIRRVFDLCSFRDANLADIFRYAINRPSHITQQDLTDVITRAIPENQSSSLIETLAQYDSNIFNSDSYRYACGHSISGAYVLRLWQQGIFDEVYVLSPSIYSIPIKPSIIDIANHITYNKDIHKGIDMGLVHIKVGNEKKDSFIRIPIIENRLKCLACEICGHQEITNCPHTPLFGELTIPKQKKGPRKKRGK